MSVQDRAPSPRVGRRRWRGGGGSARWSSRSASLTTRASRPLGRVRQRSAARTRGIVAFGACKKHERAELNRAQPPARSWPIVTSVRSSTSCSQASRPAPAWGPRLRLAGRGLVAGCRPRSAGRGERCWRSPALCAQSQMVPDVLSSDTERTGVGAVGLDGHGSASATRCRVLSCGVVPTAPAASVVGGPACACKRRHCRGRRPQGAAKDRQRRSGPRLLWGAG